MKKLDLDALLGFDKANNLPDSEKVDALIGNLEQALTDNDLIEIESITKELKSITERD